jgi:nucleoside 2-deoxyribosyltransferase
VRSIYLIGSLRNPEVPKLAAVLRDARHDVFEDWFAAGEKADSAWQEYEQGRGHSYIESLQGYAAEHVFSYDKYHLDRCDTGVLLLPAGKSAHLELGYMIGQGKPGFIVLPSEPERYDVMYKMATVVKGAEELLKHLEQ